MWCSFLRSLELQRRGSSAARLMRSPGLIAVISPSSPTRWDLNSVVYRSSEAIPRELSRLASAYASAGVRQWCVRVPAGDLVVASLLRRTGYRLEAGGFAMGMELAQLPAMIGEPPYDRTWDLAAAGTINDLAYGDADGEWFSALGELPASTGHLYLARGEGEPLSFILAHDHAGDCAIWFTATVPEARSRGLASGLVARALSDARARGCLTSTVHATDMAAPMYARLGFRRLERIDAWVRRN
jgi:GNAT superfamily N-acetyltransferase